MGDLILLSERMNDRSRPSRGATMFFFALGCPLSYLAAEQVERALGEIEWVPVPGLAPAGGPELERRRHDAEILAVAEREAQAMRLPLVAPDSRALDPRAVSRAALYATECGAGSRFALAAARLVFCGGFELDDPELIAEAAAAAGLAVDGTLKAADDERHDGPLDATLRGLHGRGIRETPAIRVGARWFEGLDAVPGASSFTAVRATLGAPLTPAG